MNFKWVFLTVVIWGLGFSCVDSAQEGNSTAQKLSSEKSLILECLNNETKSAFARDYDDWSKYWVYRNDISKTYINYPDSSFSESLGWLEISQFVKDFMAENPDPEPPPRPIDAIQVYLYDSGAWVSYEQQDSLRGRKRETRLMEKQNGQWKIAGMHTTIYGFQ